MHTEISYFVNGTYHHVTNFETNHMYNNLASSLLSYSVYPTIENYEHVLRKKERRQLILIKEDAAKESFDSRKIFKIKVYATKKTERN